MQISGSTGSQMGASEFGLESVVIGVAYSCAPDESCAGEFTRLSFRIAPRCGHGVRRQELAGGTDSETQNVWVPLMG